MRHPLFIVLGVGLALLGAFAIHTTWQSHAAKTQGVAACVAAGSTEALCRTAADAHHAQCFTLTFDHGARYRPATGLNSPQYVACILAGPDAYRAERAKERQALDQGVAADRAEARQ